MQISNFNKYFGNLVIFLVLANYTYVYTFASGLLGISFVLVSIPMMAVFGAYIAMNLNAVLALLKIRYVCWFFVLFMMIPLASAVYSPILIPRFLGYVVLQAFIFLVVLIWIHHRGWQLFAKLVLYAWLVSVGGIVLSYLAPSVFTNTALLQEAAGGGGGYGEVVISTEEQGRAFGFYMQPNKASCSILFQALFIAILLYGGAPLKRYLVLVVTLLALLLTGSRGGIIVFSALVCSLIVCELLLGARIKQRRVGFGNLVPWYFAALILGVLGIVAVVLLAQGVDYEIKSLTRVKEIFELVTKGEAEYDLSIKARMYAQEIYLHKVMGSPLWGYGLGAADYYRIIGGMMDRTSHNNFLEMAFAYGVPVAVAMYVFLLSTCFTRKNKIMRKILMYDLSICACVMIMLYTLTINTLFDSRMFPTNLALWLSVLYGYRFGSGNRLEVELAR